MTLDLSKTVNKSAISLLKKTSDMSCVVVKDRIYFVGGVMSRQNIWSLSIYGLFGADFVVRKNKFTT